MSSGIMDYLTELADKYMDAFRGLASDGGIGAVERREGVFGDVARMCIEDRRAFLAILRAKRETLDGLGNTGRAEVYDRAIQLYNEKLTAA